MAQVILKLPTVKQRTGKSRSSIYQAMKDETFPQPIKLGMRSVGWLKSEIDSWINQRIMESRSNPGEKNNEKN